MNEKLSKLTTPEECEQLALNVEKRDPRLARDARRKAVELRAAAYGAKSEVEREALEAIYAYEKALSEKRGKNVRASRTWQMIKRHGIIGTIERAVNRQVDAAGYKTLVAMGMQDFAFEAVVCRHPEVFTPEAVKRSQDRLNEWRSTDNV